MHSVGSSIRHVILGTRVLENHAYRLFELHRVSGEQDALALVPGQLCADGAALPELPTTLRGKTEVVQLWRDTEVARVSRALFVAAPQRDQLGGVDEAGPAVSSASVQEFLCYVSSAFEKVKFLAKLKKDHGRSVANTRSQGGA